MYYVTRLGGGEGWWVCYGLLRGGGGSEPLLRNEKENVNKLKDM